MFLAHPHFHTFPSFILLLVLLSSASYPTSQSFLYFVTFFLSRPSCNMSLFPVRRSRQFFLSASFSLYYMINCIFSCLLFSLIPPSSPLSISSFFGLFTLALMFFPSPLSCSSSSLLHLRRSCFPSLLCSLSPICFFVCAILLLAFSSYLFLLIVSLPLLIYPLSSFYNPSYFCSFCPLLPAAFLLSPSIYINSFHLLLLPHFAVALLLLRCDASYMPSYASCRKFYDPEAGHRRVQR